MSYVVKLLKPLIVTLFMAMTLITFAATLGRMFPVLPSFYWAGEATRYLNFWMTCLGIGAALHLGLHFSLTVVSDAYPPVLRRGGAVIVNAGMLELRPAVGRDAAAHVLRLHRHSVMWGSGHALQHPGSFQGTDVQARQPQVDKLEQ